MERPVTLDDLRPGMEVAFSALITMSGKVYWKRGVDSHVDIWGLYKKDDSELQNDGSTEEALFAYVEIAPDNGYLHPDGHWTERLDSRQPSWWNDGYWLFVRPAFEQWKQDVYALIDIERARNPFHPFRDVPPVDRVSEDQKECLRKWASVEDSVEDSVESGTPKAPNGGYRLPRRSVPVRTSFFLTGSSIRIFTSSVRSKLRGSTNLNNSRSRLRWR